MAIGVSLASRYPWDETISPAMEHRRGAVEDECGDHTGQDAQRWSMCNAVAEQRRISAVRWEASQHEKGAAEAICEIRVTQTSLGCNVRKIDRGRNCFGVG